MNQLNRDSQHLLNIMYFILSRIQLGIELSRFGFIRSITNRLE